MMLVAARLAYPLRVTLLDALDVLRRERQPRSVDDAVRAIYAWLDRRFRGRREHDEVRQMTTVKCVRAAPTFLGTTVGEAEGWVGKVYERSRIDLIRKRKRSPLGGKRSTGTDTLDPLDLIAAPANEGPDEQTEAELEHLLDALLDRVDEFVETAAKRPAHRAKMRQQAEVAILRKVRNLTAPQILEQLQNPPSEGTLYKWIERGRDQVLLPTLEGWLLEAGISAATKRFVEETSALLVSGRRADHGVSRTKDRTSVQYAEEPTSVSRLDRDEASHD